jgi:RNA 2',3'-cyclic 3'-phosphodiesterase
MPRLFTALEIPEEVAAALAVARGGLIGARWIEPEDYHITLRFIGDIDARLADEAAAALDEVRRGRVEVAFDGLDWFGGDKPRAVIAKVKPAPALVELAADHERRLRRLGLPPEKRQFTPHVTLARMRGVGPAAVADYLASRGRLEAPGFVAESFVLMSAKDGVGGGPYVVEGEYGLG